MHTIQLVQCCLLYCWNDLFTVAEFASALSIVRIGNAECVHRDVKKFRLSDIFQEECIKSKWPAKTWAQHEYYIWMTLQGTWTRPPSLTYLKLILRRKSEYHLKSLHFSLKDLSWKLNRVILEFWWLPVCPLEKGDNHPWNKCKLFLYKIYTKLVRQWFCLAGLCVQFKACIFLKMNVQRSGTSVWIFKQGSEKYM